MDSVTKQEGKVSDSPSWLLQSKSTLDKLKFVQIFSSISFVEA